MNKIITNYLVPFLISYSAAWVYGVSQDTELNYYIVILGGALLLSAVHFYRVVSRIMPILFKTGILRYYAGGQKEYINDLISELVKSNEITIVASRGLDIMGEDSDIGRSLKTLHANRKVNVYLLSSRSKYGRIRSNAIKEEVIKYKAESVSVQNYAEMLSKAIGLTVNTVWYDTKPRVRCVLLDKVAFISIYIDGMRGRNLPCMKVRCNSIIIHPVNWYIEYLKTTTA